MVARRVVARLSLSNNRIQTKYYIPQISSILSCIVYIFYFLSPDICMYVCVSVSVSVCECECDCVCVSESVSTHCHRPMKGKMAT